MKTTEYLWAVLIDDMFACTAGGGRFQAKYRKKAVALCRELREHPWNRTNRFRVVKVRVTMEVVENAAK